MYRCRVIPVLLAQNGGLVKTVKFKDPAYVGDPMNAIKIFNDKEVDELILLDIAASKSRRGPSMALIRNIASECFMPVCYGGGVSTIEQMKEIFGLGIEKIAVNAHALAHPEFIREAADVFGSQSIVCAMDIDKDLFGRYRVYHHLRRKNTTLDPLTYAQTMETLGAGEVLLNTVYKDGTMSGYDLDLIAAMSSGIRIPLVVCGGASRLEDMPPAIRHGATAVGAGSLFVFQGRHRAVLISYPSQEKLQHLFP